MSELEGQLKARAMAEGFDLVGIASAGEARTTGHLASWLAEGMHGSMAYLARSRGDRSDPRRLLAGCRSVVMVAMSYRTSLPPSQAAAADEEPRVWISRYAWGRDYHRVMKESLTALGRWLAGLCPGLAWRACVDTAPLLEREWAARAGIGWIGKGTQLVNRRLGSELFLGALLTDLRLTPDAPAGEHCGRCTACMDACPGRAIIEARRLDARRCVAYLTIEHRGPLPAEQRRSMAAMVAGCDICQEVCPWTERAAADLHPEFQPIGDRYRPLLADLDRLDELQFRHWRSGSPLTRVPFVQFRRNLEVARSNLELASPTAHAPGRRPG